MIRYLVRAAGANANLLLNVGPMPNGEIQPEFVSRLREMGVWLGKYGESIYGTRGGPLDPEPWGVTTQRANTVYVHVLDWATPLLALPELPGRIQSARVLRTEESTSWDDFQGAVILRLPDRPEAVIDEVIALEIER